MQTSARADVARSLDKAEGEFTGFGELRDY